MVFFINVLRCWQGEFLKQLRPLLVYNHFHNPCDLNPFNSHDLISNSPYCLPYSSCDVSLENLVLDQLIIPWLMFFSILITCLLDIVLILEGEILSWSLTIQWWYCKEKSQGSMGLVLHYKPNHLHHALNNSDPSWPLWEGNNLHLWCLFTFHHCWAHCLSFTLWSLLVCQNLTCINSKLLFQFFYFIAYLINQANVQRLLKITELRKIVNYFSFKKLLGPSTNVAQINNCFRGLFLPKKICSYHVHSPINSVKKCTFSVFDWFF